MRIIGITRKSSVSLRSLPDVGDVISRNRPRTGILELKAHVLALQGRSSTYEFRLLHRTFEAAIAPRLDVRRRIIGVRGTLTLVYDEDGNGAEPSQVLDLPDLPTTDDLAAQRHRNSFRSAVRSLELARAMADSARTQAEIVTRKTVQAERKAQEARLKAEAEERRSRLLADATAVTDGSMDEPQNLERLGQILVHRLADWCVVHLREGARMRRVALFARDPGGLSTLQNLFPLEEAVEFYRLALLGQSELIASATPVEIAAIVPSDDRAAALRRIGLQSLLRTPIRLQGRTIGMLTLGSCDPGRPYDVLDLRMVESIALRLAQAHETARLYDEAQREIALRKEAEGRLRVFNAELERRVQERTSLLEESIREANSFVYTVAHDLRAPLRAIAGFSETLQEDYSGALDGPGQEYLARIVAGAHRMDLLIRDLLDYARLNRVELRRAVVDLDEIADGVLLGMASEVEERRAGVEVVKPLGRVFGHAAVLSQAFTNLISNALKFVPPGAVPKVRIRSEAQKGRIRVWIEDNGIGIAAQHLERIFGIFERLNRVEEYPGTGIGLAIVRRGIERVGGRVGVESAPGAGSRFWIELPSV